MKIGLVSYLNALPYRLAFALEHDVLLNEPASINRLLQQGILDAALSSSVLGPDYHHANFGVAAKGKIGSVNLYTAVPIEQVSTVALDPASGTSNALLKILCRHHWKITPHFGPTQEAFLLIGDAGLQYQQIAGYETIDLATAWYEMTGLPFVFALLYHQQGVYLSMEKVKLWHAHLTRSPDPRLASYFQDCRYELHQEELLGLQTFWQLHAAQQDFEELNPVCYALHT